MSNEVPQRKKSRLMLMVKVIAAATVLLVLALVVSFFWPEPSLEIGPETTVISEPLNADGTPNYVAALDAMMAEGITAENNSGPLLLRVCGFDYDIPEELLQRVGLTQADLGDGKGMLISWQTWLTKNMAKPAEYEYEELALTDTLPQEPYTDTDWYTMSLDAAIEMLLERGQKHPQLEAWVEANQPSLELLYEASLRERFYLPMLTVRNQPLVVEMTEIFNAGNLFDSLRLLQIRALLQLHNDGDLSAAWQDVMTMHRLARSHANPGFGLISQLRAEHMSSSASDVAMHLTTRAEMTTKAQIPPQEGRRLLSQLMELKDVSARDPLINIFERYMMLDTIIVSHREKRFVSVPNKGYSDSAELKLPPFNVNYILRKVNALHDRVQAIQEIPEYQKRLQESQYLYNEMEHNYHSRRAKARMGSFYRLGGALTMNLLSDLLSTPMIAQFAICLEPVVESSMRARVKHDLSIVALALSIHKAEQGQYPEKLDELVPGILPELPLDGFADKPLTYRRTDEGYLLYSVGPNMTDDGGVTAESESLELPKDDMAVSVPPANTAPHE